MEYSEYAICITLAVVITLVILYVMKMYKVGEQMYDTGILPPRKEGMVYDGGMLKNLATIETMLPDREYRTLIKNYENPALKDQLY